MKAKMSRRGLYPSKRAQRALLRMRSNGVICLTDSRRLAPAFPRRLRLDRERVHAAGEFRGERRIYHAMSVDPALPFEGGRHDIDAEVCLAARPMAGVPLMQM